MDGIGIVKTRIHCLLLYAVCFSLLPVSIDASGPEVSSQPPEIGFYTLMFRNGSRQTGRITKSDLEKFEMDTGSRGNIRLPWSYVDSWKREKPAEVFSLFAGKALKQDDPDRAMEWALQSLGQDPEIELDERLKELLARESVEQARVEERQRQAELDLVHEHLDRHRPASARIGPENYQGPPEA
jgi:hypothetical protein